MTWNRADAMALCDKYPTKPETITTVEDPFTT